MTTSTARAANEAWESLFRAQATVLRDLLESDAMGELDPSEYGVLYALSKLPDGARIGDLQADVLLTQTGMSRLISRMEDRGLVERRDDPTDRRACRVVPTAAGRRLQREVGLRHGHEVARRMTGVLDRDELLQLRDLCRRLAARPRVADDRGRA